MSSWSDRQREIAAWPFRPARTGRVYALSVAEQVEAEIAGMVRDQTTAVTQLSTLLTLAAQLADKMDFPLGSPTEGFDVDDIRAALREMIPTQTADAMWERASEIVRERAL